MTTPKTDDLTIFMLVKTSPEWLGHNVPERFSLLRQHVDPILHRHADGVGLRFFDAEFYTARVSDVMVWTVRDRHAYELLVEDLRATPFWDRWFTIVEIIPSVENAYATNYDQPALGV